MGKIKSIRKIIKKTAILSIGGSRGEGLLFCHGLNENWIADG